MKTIDDAKIAARRVCKITVKFGNDACLIMVPGLFSSPCVSSDILGLSESDVDRAWVSLRILVFASLEPQVPSLWWEASKLVSECASCVFGCLADFGICADSVAAVTEPPC